MVCPVPGKHEQYYQAGIVAWGIGCADVNPGQLYREWGKTQIIHILGSHSSEKTFELN